MKFNCAQISRINRRAVKWLLLFMLAGFVLYRVKFAPVPVVTHQMASGPLVAEVTGTGTLEARVKTTISPHIQQPLAEVLVDQNDRVAAGQLLARLDDSELKRQVEVAEAGLAAARATFDRVKTDEARALAAEKLARLTCKRESDLLPTQSTSQQDFDTASATLQTAGADVKRTQAATIEAERQLATAEKTLAYQKELLGFTRILSPYGGLIVRRDCDPGQIVVPGTSILQLVATNEIWVAAWVDETAMAALAPGQPAHIVFRSEPAKNYPGKVARLGRQVDTETREFEVDVDATVLPNNWAVGQRAEVYIETGRKAGALVLPLSFLNWRAGKPGVFVNDRGKARWRELQLGMRGLETVEVVQGLSPDEAVCKAREAKSPMVDGQRVSVSDTRGIKSGDAK